MKIQYRSSGLSPGFFNGLGVLHVHVDGAEDQSVILRILQELERRGNPSKINVVDRFVAGPQRKSLPTIYQAHTPALAGREEFEFFSTTLLKDRSDAVNVVNFLGHALGRSPGVVIEVEQPVMWLGPKAWRDYPKSLWVPQIEAAEVGLAPGPSLRFEIHHGFDLPKEGVQYPLEFLGEFCSRHFVEFGGWFVFEKPAAWAYRSNSFSEEGVIEQVEREQEVLNLFLQGRCRCRTLVEKILGIWKS